MGVPTKFISILGDDEKGKSIINHSKEIGYDMSDSLILKDCTTPTYMAILDEKGEMVSAVIDMWSLTQIDKAFVDSKRDIIENAEYVIVDSDNPAILEYLLKTFQGKTRFILDPVSAAKAEDIRHLIPYFHTIKPNRFEAEVLADMPINVEADLLKAADKLLAMGLESLFISLDEDGIFYASLSGKGKVQAKASAVVNVTGAGDAFVAGLGYGYMNHLDVVDTVKFAMSMSLLTISHPSTIHPDMCLASVRAILEAAEWQETIY
jgi:pseudouridine kinase